MIDFAALQEYVYNNRVIDSEYHGLEHWRQVEFNGLLLAPRTGADITVVRLFALFHDCKREDDGYDGGHGERGAEFAKKCFDEKLLDITQEQFEKLYYACRMHTHERFNDDATISEAAGIYTVKVDVKNTGDKAGRNVVELFVAAPNSKKTNKPEKELRNYAKTKLLQPGETETITMTVSTEDLASFNEKASAWKTDAGVYTFMICSSANDVEAKATAKVKAWTKKVNNVMKPNVKLNLLRR